MTALDATRPVRAGEELDVVRLAPWLSTALGKNVAPEEIRVEQFPRGHSNLTYLVRIGSDELVLRRPPFGTKVKSAHDMGREQRILSRIAGHYPAPRPLGYCDDPAVLGAPFYIMERLAGVVVRLDPPAELVAGPDAADAPHRVRALGELFIDGLAQLHTLDWAALGLSDLGHPEGYIARQVQGWTERYRAAKTDDIPDMDWLAAWLDERKPKEVGACLIHNDYKYDNVVLDPSLTSIVGVLDWEMSTIGDPLMDLGTTLAYWVQADDPDGLLAIRFCATTLPGSLTRQELVERYAAARKFSPPDLLFYYCFALYKTAGVAQQIYVRWKEGLTTDARFAAMLTGVKILSESARRSAERGRI